MYKLRLKNHTVPEASDNNSSGKTNKQLKLTLLEQKVADAQLSSKTKNI